MENHESNTQTQSKPSFVTQNEGPSAPGGPLNLSIKMQLNTAINARRTLARILRLYAAGKIDTVQYKGLVYGFGALLPFFKMELESELLKRLEALEKQLEARK